MDKKEGRKVTPPAGADLSQLGSTGGAFGTCALGLATADRVADGALQAARKMGIQPVCAVVLDGAGHALVMKREDGASFFRESIARAKAWGALAMGYSSGTIGERFKDRPAFLSAITTLADGKIVPVAGGVLVAHAGLVIGAVGISGASSEEDEKCALAGIEAAGRAGCPVEVGGA